MALSGEVLITGAPVHSIRAISLPTEERWEAEPPILRGVPL